MMINHKLQVLCPKLTSLPDSELALRRVVLRLPAFEFVKTLPRHATQSKPSIRENALGKS